MFNQDPGERVKICSLNQRTPSNLFSKILTSPSGQGSQKSTCPEAKFTRHGRLDEC